MKKQIRTLGFCLSILATACITSYAGVAYSLDGSTTTSSTAWPGTPTMSLALPNQGNVYEGGGANGGVEGIVFQAASSFTLGAVEFQATSAGVNVSLSLYDLGPSFVPAGGGSASNYTITGSSVNLFTSGLNATLSPSGDGFHVLTFSGADQVSLTSGNWYTLELLDNDPVNALLVRRASTGIATTVLTLGTGATGTRNNVPAGDRDPVGALYAPIPEPSSMALLGMGALVGIFAIRRRR